MPIDYNARLRLAESRKTNTLVGAMKDTISQSLKSGNPNEEVLKLVIKREDEPKLLEQMGKIGTALAMIYKTMLRPLPALFKIKGQVEVIKTPPVKITNFEEFGKYFKSLESSIRVWAQAASMAPAPQIKIPDFPKIEIPKADNGKLEELLKNLVDEVKNIKPSEIKFPKEINVGNFPITHTPQPVTNININGLQGFAKSTAVTVTTALTELPAYGELNNRRTMIIFNNGSATVYIGGSDVTSSNGLPVAASSYSPAIDAGVNLKIYGVTASSSSDVRVLEVSSNQTASKVQ